MLGLVIAALAQEALPTPVTAGQDIVVLDPFVVDTTKDNGYIATDSLAGGRQAAPIRVTPAPISSLTGQFINDLALTNVLDLLTWSLNTVPTSDRSGFSGGTAGNVFGFWSISTRGGQSFFGGNPPTKNYFPLFVVSDTYNVERVEFDMGPNSILFGIGDIGGAMSSYTKVARFDRNFDHLAVSLDSYGGYRGTIDVNQSAGDLALRLNAVAADEQGWRDGDHHQKLGATLAVDYRFNHDRSHLRFEIEGWKEKKSIYQASYQDNASLWDKTTSAATWGAAIPNLGANPLNTPGAPGVTGMSDWGLGTYNVFVPGVGLMNWAEGVRSMGTNNIDRGAFLRPDSYTYAPTGTTIMALPSRAFAVGPKNGYVRPEDVNLTLTLDQKINEHMDFEVSGYHYADDIYALNFEGGYSVSYDLNRQLPNGQPNPNFGKPYSDFFLDKQVQNHWANEVRGQFSYHVDGTVANVPVKQLFSVSAGEQVTEYDARQYQAVDTALDPTLANWNEAGFTTDMVWGRLYWDNPHAAFNVPNTVRYLPLPFNWFDFDSRQTIKYGGAFSQTRIWDDRLNLTLGLRRDSYDDTRHGLRGASNPPINGTGAGNTYSVGVIGYITDWLGVFANISDNYQPVAGGLTTGLFGDVRGASFGKAQNAGLRVSTKDGRYYASLTWYKDTAEDVIGGDSPDLQGLWNDYFAAGGLKTDVGPAGAVYGSPGSYSTALFYSVTYDVKYTGFEFELIANPTRNLRLQVHYAAPKGQRTHDGLEAVAYFKQHLPDWQALAQGTSLESQKLASDIAFAQYLFSIWAVPTLAGGVTKSTWNAFAVYTFNGDTLKGFDLGFGAAEKGARQVDEVNRTTAYTTESLMLGYSRTLGAMGRKVQARVQLNVDNLFGNKALVFQDYWPYGQPMDFNFIPPRKLTLSAQFEF